MPCIFSSRSSGTFRASGGAAKTVSARDPSCKWSEEDPQIEVARRKLEQGGTALFVREQQVWAGTRKQRVPLLARARRRFRARSGLRLLRARRAAVPLFVLPGAPPGVAALQVQPLQQEWY